jgi:CDP-glucose 4,6-dehydratase
VGVTPESWQGRQVLLTGHTGFKGSWLSLWLQLAGAQVTGYALPPPTSPNLFTLARVGDGMTSIQGDVRDLSTLTGVMRRAQPEVAIHMAAQALVRRSYQDPVETYSANVVGTANFLEAVRQTQGVRAVLVVTSDKCYRNDGRTSGYSEDDPLGGTDPYSSSKAACELVVGSYLATNWLGQGGPPLASARAGNVIAGGDWAGDRLIPDVMRCVLRDEPLVVRYPAAVRPWQHVLDCLNGYLMLCERMLTDGNSSSGAWNFGPDDSERQTVGSLVEQLWTLWGGVPKVVRPDAPQPPEANYLQLDSTKARRELAWAPRLSIQQTLESIVAWYRVYGERGDLATLTRAQIRSFQDQT